MNTDDVLAGIDEALAWEADWERHAMHWNPDPTPERESRTRVFVLSDVADVTAPTMAELRRGLCISGYFAAAVQPPSAASVIRGMDFTC